MTTKFHPSSFRRFAPVFIFITLALVCAYPLYVWLWRDNARPAEKRVARNLELAAYGPGRENSSGDYCIPRLGLPACSAELLENEAPGTPCYVQKCSQGHVTSLSLYGGQLEALPAEIAGLPGLTELSLHQNKLTRLPPEIGQLSSLSELDVSGNHLTGLPPEIGRLSNLKKLDVSGNDLTSLPPEIGQLRSLTYLNVAGNPIRGPLPAFLTRLPLDALVFSKTGLCIPVDEQFQAWIRSIAAINHQASPRPADVCSLAAEDQQAMQALYKIPGRPADWHLSEFPCAWSRTGCDSAGHVIRLDLSAIPLVRLPPEIGQLVYLQSLNLTNTQLSELPPEIGKLRSLTHLYLSENQLARLPVEFGQLGSLTELDLSKNHLTSLPAGIGQLHSLVSLNLYGNQLASLPPELGQLTSLTLLDVSENPLSGALPVFLTHLPGVAFVFSNTNLCIPKDAEILNWLGRQAKGVYTYTAAGEQAYQPPNPQASIESYLKQRGCR